MRPFECRREIELPGTPDQVWAAVATSEGNEAWLFPNPIAPGQGSHASDGITTTTAWDPPHHFAVRSEQGDWFNALDFEIEGQGGTTLLRYVHGGIFVDDWDSQYDAVSQHTDFYLHTLSEYLGHFAGRKATYVGDGPGGLQAPQASMAAGSFERLKQALGLPDSVAEGQSVSLTPRGLPRIQAVVDYVRPNFLGLRTAAGLYRFFGRNAFGSHIGMSAHLFDAEIDPAQTAQAWQSFLDGVYA
ncbi:MAG: SRPBCC domain-containing protein [Chloroflexota bacterium]